MENVQKLTGFVALLDVLGFRELIGRDDDLPQVRQYAETISSLLDIDASALQFVLFSDNVVINTRDASAESFRRLIVVCSNIFFELAKQRLAVRGAIAYGSFMRSPTTEQGVILAGRPIVEASHYQQVQDWVGIMLAPSVIRNNDALPEKCRIGAIRSGETKGQWAERSLLAMHLQQWGGIPFHKDSPFTDNHSLEGYAVVPLRRGILSPADLRGSFEGAKRQLEIMKLGAPDPASQNKYRKTLNWLDAVERSYTMVGLWEPEKTLEIRPSPGVVLEPFVETSHGETHYRMELHNSETETARNVQVKLINIEPPPGSEYFRARVDFPYIVRLAHLAGNIVDNSMAHDINPGDDRQFELLYFWESSDHRLMVNGIDTKQALRDAMFSVEENESWQVNYEVSSAQTSIQRPSFLVRREGMKLLVSRLA